MPDEINSDPMEQAFETFMGEFPQKAAQEIMRSTLRPSERDSSLELFRLCVRHAFHRGSMEQALQMSVSRRNLEEETLQ